MLTEGLVPELNASWGDVQKTVSDLALGLVPDFLLAGQESAVGYVNGTIKQLEQEENRLRQIGKNIGKPIGANIKAEIAKAVAEAVKEAEAAKSAAAAERASQIAAQQVVVTEQQVAQALNRLIVNSNARTGYQTAPTTSPVFG
jgi:prophage tail gpP-like protein